MKKRIGLLLLPLVLLGIGCASDDIANSTTETIVLDRDAILLQAKENGLIMDDAEIGGMTDHGVDSAPTSAWVNPDQDVKGWSSAALADVTAGQSFGLAYSSYENGKYTLIAKMGNLPLPGEGYFYEGWIVRRGNEMSVVSTGVVSLKADQYVNTFSVYQDLSDHDFYVLTLEPDDGDPAPAEHILEGILK
ncbi:anti-sigma factor [Candidatus Uhrbacteria bacterium]|jgi:hypothetical protein|nr:anti-sigma factor [Candidatus Uhrbacteria bacterium]